MTRQMTRKYVEKRRYRPNCKDKDGLCAFGDAIREVLGLEPIHQRVTSSNGHKHFDKQEAARFYREPVHYSARAPFGHVQKKSGC